MSRRNFQSSTGRAAVHTSKITSCTGTAGAAPNQSSAETVAAPLLTIYPPTPACCSGGKDQNTKLIRVYAHTCSFSKYIKKTKYPIGCLAKDYQQKRAAIKHGLPVCKIKTSTHGIRPISKALTWALNSLDAHASRTPNSFGCLSLNQSQTASHNFPLGTSNASA